MPALAKKMSSPPCVFGDVVHQALDVRFAARVRANVGSVADVGADDGRALGPEQLDRRLADARRGAGDDRDLPVQPAHQPLIATAATS